MARSSETLKPHLELRVNGIPDPTLRFRWSDEDPDDLDLVLDDQLLGALALTADYSLEVRQADGEWRAVTLDELKSLVLDNREVLVVDDLPKASEMVEMRCFQRLDDLEGRHRPSSRLGELTGHSECGRRVQTLLYQAGIPHKIAGTVFTVPNLRRARNVLDEAGFYPSPYSPSALIEPRTQCAIYLLEKPI